MRQIDLGWIIGFLEGEGTFYKTGKRKKYSHPQYRYARIEASQKTLEPIKKLQTLLGGTVTRLKWYEGHFGGPLWRWSIAGKQARMFMVKFFPHLSKRRQGQVRRALR